MTTNKEKKELPCTMEPLDFIDRLAEDQLKEFAEIIERYLGVSKIVNFLEDVKGSSYLTKNERAMLEEDFVHFCDIQMLLSKKLGFWYL